MLALSAVWQLFDAVAMTLSEALRAAGDTTWCMIARIVLAWFVFTPVAWTVVLVFDGGVVTVMLALSLYIAMLAATFSFRFASGRWKRIELVEEPQLV
jgi:MATE family multidrug resistance protein